MLKTGNTLIRGAQQSLAIGGVRQASTTALLHNSRVLSTNSRNLAWHPRNCVCRNCGKALNGLFSSLSSSNSSSSSYGPAARRRFTTAAQEENQQQKAEAGENGNNGNAAEKAEETKDTAQSNGNGNGKVEVVTMAKHQEALKLKDAQIAEFKDRLVRQLAETENVRRRSEIEKENATKFGVTKFGKNLLEVSDNLELSMESVQGFYDQCKSTPDTVTAEDGVKNFTALFEGLQLIHRVLHKAFEQSEIRKFETLGKPFDHNFHDAVFQMDHPEYPPGTCGQVMKEGYTIHERILRPAAVGVVRNPEQD